MPSKNSGRRERGAGERLPEGFGAAPGAFGGGFASPKGFAGYPKPSGLSSQQFSQLLAVWSLGEAVRGMWSLGLPGEGCDP